MSRQSYMFNVLNFTGASAAGSALAATGTWDDVDDYQHIRIGAIAFDAASAWGDPGLWHAFSAGAEIPQGATMQMRLYDEGNTAVLVAASKTNNFSQAYSFTLVNLTSFENLPAGNARIRLEYQLSGSVAGVFYWATWAVSNTP